MAWIESHQSLATHRKLLALCSALNVSRATAIGHLHMLWWWALDNAPDGDLSGVSDEIIASVCGFLDSPARRVRVLSRVVVSSPRDECARFARGLRDTGWIDSDNKLHHWDDYAGKLIRAREVDRVRHRKSHGTPTEVRRNSEATVPNRTQPYPTTTTAAPENALAVAVKAYEDNFGIVNGIIAEELKSAATSYPEGWIPDAIAEAVKANARRWSYVAKILERWKVEGRNNGNGHKANGPATGDGRPNPRTIVTRTKYTKPEDLRLGRGNGRTDTATPGTGTPIGQGSATGFPSSE